MGQQKGHLIDNRAVMLSVDLYQLSTLLLLLWSQVRDGRQVEYEFTGFALKVTCQCLQELRQELWQHRWNPGASVWVHGLDVLTHHSRVEGTSTK